MLNSPHIIIVDDHMEICMLVKDFLAQYNFKSSIATNADTLFSLLKSDETINLIVLDLMLPGLNGIEICKQLRRQGNCTPIIMLTAVNDSIDTVLSLELGADDYLTKPFEPRELLARIKALLRRYEIAYDNNTIPVESNFKGKLLKFAGWTLNTASRQLFSPDNIEITLSSKGYDLLVAFLEHPHQILSRDHLLSILSNRSVQSFDRSIDVQVSRLRQKLNDDPQTPKLIKTVRSGGYLFAETVKKA